MSDKVITAYQNYRPKAQEQSRELVALGSLSEKGKLMVSLHSSWPGCRYGSTS